MSTKKRYDEATSTASTNPTAPPAPHPGDMPSINEPPGSDVSPQEGAQKDPAEASQGVTKNVSHETSDELPSDAELERATRAELDNLAEERGVNINHAHNKDEVIAALRKDARKRHR